MVIFHSCVNVYQRVFNVHFRLTQVVSCATVPEISPCCDGERFRPSAAASDKAPARLRPDSASTNRRGRLMRHSQRLRCCEHSIWGMVYTTHLWIFMVILGMIYCWVDPKHGFGSARIAMVLYKQLDWIRATQVHHETPSSSQVPNYLNKRCNEVCFPGLLRQIHL